MKLYYLTINLPPHISLRQCFYKTGIINQWYNWQSHFLWIFERQQAYCNLSKPCNMLSAFPALFPKVFFPILLCSLLLSYRLSPTFTKFFVLKCFCQTCQLYSISQRYKLESKLQHTKRIFSFWALRQDATSLPCYGTGIYMSLDTFTLKSVGTYLRLPYNKLRPENNDLSLPFCIILRADGVSHPAKRADHCLRIRFFGNYPENGFVHAPDDYGKFSSGQVIEFLFLYAQLSFEFFYIHFCIPKEGFIFAKTKYL